MGNPARWVQGKLCFLICVSTGLHCQEAFTDQNYQAFFGMTVEVLVRPWEKMITGMKFTEVRFASICSLYSYD
jgi:hypothetical protein